MAETVNVMFLGSTGVGKSAVCNFIGENMGMTKHPFEESEGAASCTHDVKDVVVADRVRLIDTPGLLDTNGAKVDGENLRKIIEEGKKLKVIQAAVIVLNYKCRRCDDGIQNAVKLFIDSFRREILGHLCILFTHFVFDEDEIRKLEGISDEYRHMIEVRCGCVIENLPFYFVDCHPDELRKSHSSPDWIENVGQKSRQQVADMFSWIHKLKPFSTADAVFGEYEHVRLLREAEERRAFDNSIISCVTEKRKQEVSRSTTSYQVNNGWWECKWYNFGHETWHDNMVTVTKVTINMVEEERNVITRGNGTVSMEDWKVVRKWTE